MHSLRTTRLSLMARIRGEAGDPSVWSDFVAIYGPAVLHWCRRHGLQDADARDVAQEVLVRFWRHAEKFRYDPSRRFRAYLRRIVFTALADWRESRRADRVVKNGAAVEAILASAPAREDLASRLERAFDMERLSTAMAEVEGRVKPTTWAAFRMLAIDRLPGPEVARRLGMETPNVYMARMNVQRMISETVRRHAAATP